MPFRLTEEGISQSQTARIHLKISPLSGLLCLSCIMIFCFFFLHVGLAVRLRLISYQYIQQYNNDSFVIGRKLHYPNVRL